MSAFGTGDMATALPDAVPNTVPDATAGDGGDGGEKKDPQAHGWVPALNYDYATYNKSTKELADAQLPADGQFAEAEG